MVKIKYLQLQSIIDIVHFVKISTFENILLCIKRFDKVTLIFKIEQQQFLYFVFTEEALTYSISL